MEIRTEYEKNFFDYFRIYKDKECVQYSKDIPKMSVISMNAYGIGGKIDKEEFLSIVFQGISNIFRHNNSLMEYKMYLFVNYEMKNPYSKVENYKKIWGQIERKFNIKGFILGEELKMQKGCKYVFSSIAEVPLLYLNESINIISTNPSQCTLFMGKTDGKLSRRSIEEMFTVMKDDIEIDYYKLSSMCCKKGDIVLRYGTSFEEAELALIYNPEIVGNLNKK